MNLYIQKIGTGVVVGICSLSRQEVEHQFNSFWNWRATDGELHWSNDGYGTFYGYFWTNEDKLGRWAFLSATSELAGNERLCLGFKRKKSGFKDKIKNLAAAKLRAFEEREVVPQNSSCDYTFECNSIYGNI